MLIRLGAGFHALAAAHKLEPRMLLCPADHCELNAHRLGHGLCFGKRFGCEHHAELIVIAPSQRCLLGVFSRQAAARSRRKRNGLEI